MVLFIRIKLVGLGALEISTGGSFSWIFDRNPVGYMKCSQKFLSKAPDVDAVHWLLRLKGWFSRLVFYMNQFSDKAQFKIAVTCRWWQRK
jgi:hypothetical protein